MVVKFLTVCETQFHAVSQHSQCLFLCKNVCQMVRICKNWCYALFAEKPIEQMRNKMVRQMVLIWYMGAIVPTYCPSQLRWFNRKIINNLIERKTHRKTERTSQKQRRTSRNRHKTGRNRCITKSSRQMQRAVCGYNKTEIPWFVRTNETENGAQSKDKHNLFLVITYLMF